MAQSKNPDLVRSNRLFAGLYDFKFNFKDKNFLELKEGEVIFSKGDKSEYMYLVIYGRVKFKIYENPRQPKVYLVSRNEFFGEQELINKLPRNSSALAEKDSYLFRISHKDFIRLSTTYRKILQNLTERKYEEVVPATRNSELKQDLFKRILNESESASSREKGIDIKDYSDENPLLELKAKDEINEELKMYDDKSEDTGTDDLIVDDEDVKWEFDTETEEEITGAEPPEEEPFEEPEEDSKLIPEEDILSDFIKIRSQVDLLHDSLKDTDEELPSETIPFRIESKQPEKEFIDAVIKITSGNSREETEKFIVEACCNLLSAESGLLLYPEGDGLKGKFFEESTEIIFPAESIAGKSYSQSRLINIKDIFNDQDFNPALDYVSFFHIQNLICIPVPESGPVKYVLQLFNSRNSEFSENDEQLLKNIAPLIYNSLTRFETYRNNGSAEAYPKEQEQPPVEIKIAEIPADTVETLPPEERKISVKVLSEFLLKEFQVVVGDIKQFNSYLQRTDIPGEAKEIADIVTNQAAKMIDLLESLKGFSDLKKTINPENQSFVSLIDDMVNPLAEYTESRKVNLFKKFEYDDEISADPRFLYLALLQIIKYQCELMPFGGNIFISSEKTDTGIELIIRNATKRTDETLIVSPAIDFNDNSVSGLGLSLAKKIIEDHGASMEIKNQSGTGLLIGIHFPSAH